MHTHETIEDLLQNELHSLCTNCAKAMHCSYRKAAHRIIIQCEQYEVSEQREVNEPVPRPAGGLCGSCCSAAFCKLPGREGGVWRCKEYT